MKPSDYIAAKQKKTVHVESLLNLCQRCLIEHRCKIKCVGEVPRSLLLPVLERCSAEQLIRIENFNPNFISEDEPLWSKLFKMDFPNELPVIDRLSWREAYIQAKLERDKKLEGASAKLKRSYDQASEARKSRQLIVTDMKTESVKRTGLRIPSKTKSSNAILKKASFETRNVADKFKRTPIVSHSTTSKVNLAKKPEISTHRTTPKLMKPMAISHTSLSKTSTHDATESIPKSNTSKDPKSNKHISTSGNNTSTHRFSESIGKTNLSLNSNNSQINSKMTQNMTIGVKGTSDRPTGDKSNAWRKTSSSDETLKIEKLQTQKGIIDSSFIQKFFG